MPAIHIQRSTVIDAPVEKVFDTVADFGTWSIWSPWPGIDKDATLSVSEDSSSPGARYAWSGEVVGTGEVGHVQLDRPRRLDDQLRISKPYPSTSSLSFTLEPSDRGTAITWQMRGSLPWFLFWMRKQMEMFLGMDHQRCLNMLREYIETGTVLSKVEVMGKLQVDAIEMLGVRATCSTEEIGSAMESAIASAKSILGDHGISTAGEMISVYHPCDLSKGFDFTTGFVVAGNPQIPAGIDRCSLPAGQALQLRHTGCYEHLGNAWGGAHHYVRAKKLKIARCDGYEIYRNDPNSVPASEWITDIYLPLR